MPAHLARRRDAQATNDWRATATPEDFIVEAWGQGFMVGALIVMICITISNMRSKVLLHKLILAELIFAMSHGTFCFMAFPGYGWYLSSTAALLYISYWLHNLVAWLKIRPFFKGTNAIFSPKTSRIIKWIYLVTLGLSIVPLSIQIANNFLFFNNIKYWYGAFRPYETLMRDPWWVFVCTMLFRVVRKSYDTTTVSLVQGSARFGILVASIVLAVIFTILDIISSVHPHWFGATDGLNPWWKLYLIFKCLTDTIILDDFKVALDQLSQKFVARQASVPYIAEYERHKEDIDDVVGRRGTWILPPEDHGTSVPGYGQHSSGDPSKG